MKRSLKLVLFAALMVTLPAGVGAQPEVEADQGVDDLRVRLIDAQAKEAELQAQAKQIDEALKPENIERSLAGVGSTKPEELRALRRRELEIERDRARAQLRIVTTGRERLETVIHSLEADAYHRSAEESAPLNQIFSQYYANDPRLVLGLLGGLVAISGLVILSVLIRRLNA